MNWRRIIEGLGRTLMGAGTLILLFVAYQLWGTGLHEARSQDALREDTEEIEKFFDEPPATTAPGAPPATQPASPPATQPATAPTAPSGKAVAIIRIPKIGVDKAVVQGVGLNDLKKGPGHYPHTPMPGEPGNSAIAGHRTTYGAPFGALDKLDKGDQIFIATKAGAFRYDVITKEVVRPSQGDVLHEKGDNRLTLTTCHPRYSAARRLIVSAVLVGPVVPGSAIEPGATATTAPPSPTTTAPPSPTTTEASPITTSDPSTVGEGIDFDDPGLSGDGSARGDTIIWGFVVAGVFFVMVSIAHRWRRRTTYLLGTPLFLVVLFMFFENFSRLLPPNI